MADLVKELKRESSQSLKAKAGRDFYWQKGYRAFSISPSHVEPLRMYIANQEEHHRVRTFQEEFRELLRKYGLEWDGGFRSFVLGRRLCNAFGVGIARGAAFPGLRYA